MYLKNIINMSLIIKCDKQSTWSSINETKLLTRQANLYLKKFNIRLILKKLKIKLLKTLPLGCK